MSGNECRQDRESVKGQLGQPRTSIQAGSARSSLYGDKKILVFRGEKQDECFLEEFVRGGNQRTIIMFSCHVEKPP